MTLTEEEITPIIAENDFKIIIQCSKLRDGTLEQQLANNTETIRYLELRQDQRIHTNKSITPTKSQNDGRYIIESGFQGAIKHEYNIDVNKEYSPIIQKHFLSVAYNPIDRVKQRFTLPTFYCDLVLLEATVPKGAIYYKSNELNFITTDTIIVNLAQEHLQHAD